jgi:hypothetical protein
MNSKSVLNQFMDIVIPLGKQKPEFFLYAMRKLHDKPIKNVSVEKWPEGILTSHYELWDDNWPCVIELIEITAPQISSIHILNHALKSGLDDVTNQGAFCAWYMFDGAFGDVDKLFTQWHVENIYGICTPKMEPLLAIAESQRQSKKWSLLLKQVSKEIYTAFPSLSQIS